SRCRPEQGRSAPPGRVRAPGAPGAGGPDGGARDYGLAVAVRAAPLDLGGVRLDLAEVRAARGVVAAGAVVVGRLRRGHGTGGQCGGQDGHGQGGSDAHGIPLGSVTDHAQRSPFTAAHTPHSTLTDAPVCPDRWLPARQRSSRTRPPTSVHPCGCGAVRSWEPVPWVMFRARPSRSVSSIAAAPVASSSTAVGAPPVSPASSAPSGSTASAAPSGSPSRAAGSGPGPSSRWVKAWARTRPPGSSSQAQAYKGGSSAPIDGTASPSTSAADAYWRRVYRGAHSARASIQQNSPSCRAPITPASVVSSGTSSSQAAPTQGVPVKVGRPAGVRMSITPRSGSSTNTVRPKPSFAASACLSPSSGSTDPLRTTPTSSPYSPRGPQRPRSTS